MTTGKLSTDLRWALVHLIVFVSQCGGALGSVVPNGGVNNSIWSYTDDTVNNNYTNNDTGHTGGGEHMERYPVVVVDFERVEDPFIISLWIFCACLGKIGKFHSEIYMSRIRNFIK